MRFIPRPRLFGPMLPYDMVRLARRGRFIAVRAFYASLLGGILGMAYFTWTQDHPGGIQPSEIPDFTAGFFYTFLAVQFATILLLTPAYTAGAIAEEKEQRTLDYLLTTDLRRREIVLGKLASRLAALGLIVLAGLPVLSIIQLMGGVDPFLLLAGFLVSGITMGSLAGLSILCSVQLKRARDAIVMTYALVLLYLALSGLSWLLIVPQGWAKWPSTDVWNSPVDVEHVVNSLNAGNPVSGLALISQAVFSGADVHEAAASHYGYVLFHAAVAVIGSAWAVLRVRVVAQTQSESMATKSKTLRVRRRPRVGDRPVLWKEVYIEGRSHRGWFRLVVLASLAILSFVPAIWMTVDFVVARFSDAVVLSPAYSSEMGWWARIVASAVVCFTLLVVGIRAAGSISGECERQTFDALLTSPLASRDLLFGKWLGSIVGTSGGWIWAALIVLVGTVTGGIHVLALPLLLVAWCVYAAFMAGMGLWFSLYCRTSLRASIGTVVGAIGFCCGHWLIWLCGIPIAMVDPNAPWMDKVGEWLATFQSFGLMPPVTMGFLAFNVEDFTGYQDLNDETLIMLICAIVGVGLYGIGAYAWWRAVCSRFKAVYRRSARASAVANVEIPVATS